MRHKSRMQLRFFMFLSTDCVLYLKSNTIAHSKVMLFFHVPAGDVWVFSVYQPNYDPAAADGRYCNKNLYTFAFWNAVYETFAMFVVVAKFLKGMMCYVVMNPAPANRAFYRNA